jgi:hypothetical protein
VTPTLSVRARFERFPATLKGAFIIRGEDPDPHQVVLGPARIVPVTGGEGRPIAIADSTLDIAPKQDVFVPFETGVSELEPGWYELHLEAEVDGVRNTYPRRGSVRVGKELKLDGVRVRLEQLECATDHVAVSLRTTPPSAVVVTLEASGHPLPVFDVQRDEETGAVTLTAYPIRKTDPNLRVSVVCGGSSASVDVPLP